MKTILVILNLFAFSAYAQSSVELMCRNQAKETAVRVYNECYQTNISSKMNEIQKSYKSEQTMMKKKYQQQIDELVGKAPAKPAQNKASDMTPTVRRPEKATVSGLTQTLPQKKNDNGPALPVQQIQEAPAAVAPVQEDNEVPEIVDLPVQN